MPLQCRVLDDADLPLVIDLAHRIWPQAYAGVLTGEQIANILGRIYTIDNLRREMAAGHRFWGAYDGDVALGFASGYRDGDAVRIKKLYVLPKAQGRGAGRALIDVVAAAFGAARELRLLVNNANTSAQGFYERSGFVRTATVPVEMGDFRFSDYLYVKQVR